MKLSVDIAGLRLKNPLIAASGTFGYGVEYEGILDLSVLGGIVSKGLYLEARDGCATPRIVETPSGLLNAIGLQGVGVRAFVRDVLPRLAPIDTAILVNVCGDTVEEYAEVTRILDQAPGVAAVEINISCPNVGHDATKLVHEAKHMLDVGRPLGVPFIVNINLLVTPGEAVEISRHPACAAVSQSNSIPWGAFPERIPWKKIFGSDTSPLVKRGFGLGGYSGPYALPILLDWIHAVRCASSGNQWLIAGGGIQSVNDAEAVCRVGHPILKGIKLGVVCIVRPWRVQPIIRRVNRHFESLDRTKRAKQGSAT